MLSVGILTNFQPVLLYVCDYGMSIYGQLGLKRGKLAMAKPGQVARTLNTTRILLSSDHQEAIVSLSFLA